MEFGNDENHLCDSMNQGIKGPRTYHILRSRILLSGLRPVPSIQDCDVGLYLRHRATVASDEISGQHGWAFSVESSSTCIFERALVKHMCEYV